MVSRAWELASEGSVTQAEVLFSRAVRNGGPETLLESARFMRRRGRLEAAYQLDREYIEATASKDGLDMRVNRSRALANMGVVRRKQGNLRESRGHLVEAVAVARTAGPDGDVPLAYALDNLAHTAAQQGDLATAEHSLEEAHSIRARDDDQAGIAQSLINLSLSQTSPRGQRTRVGTTDDSDRDSSQLEWPRDFASQRAGRGRRGSTRSRTTRRRINGTRRPRPERTSSQQ